MVKTPARLKSIVQIDDRKRCTDTGGWIKISNASSARTEVSPSTSLQCGPQNVCTQQPSGRCVSKLWMFVGSSSKTTKDVTVGAPRKNIAISSPRVCSCNTGVSPMTGLRLQTEHVTKSLAKREWSATNCSPRLQLVSSAQEPAAHQGSVAQVAALRSSADVPDFDLAGHTRDLHTTAATENCTARHLHRGRLKHVGYPCQAPAQGPKQRAMT